MRKRRIGVASLVFLLTGCAGNEPDRGAQYRAEGGMMLERGPQNFVPGEYIVTLAPNETRSAIETIYRSYEVRFVQELGGSKYLIRLGKDPGLAAVQSTGQASGKVKAVQPNFVYRHGAD